MAAIVLPHAAAAQTSGAAAQPAPVDYDEDERADDYLHSPVPLYGFEWPELWPRSLDSATDIGCASRVGFGDWRFTPDPGDAYGEEHWERVANFGAIHCAAVLSMADRRSELKRAPSDRGFFVRLGVAQKGPARWELWAVQRGFVPGSSYVLLAREEGDSAEAGVISRFTVLQRRCPADKLVDSGGVDVWSTRYCRVGSRDELLTLAREMLTLPPLGVIALDGKTR
ncbi:hypothetical protein DMC47_08600 [Nostoc sp. 3335mG]|nr:hypothetical protein DMC47_08600 [Nostoc sp. 3335mG]